MYEMFTASELAEKWNCSDKTARKAANRERFESGFKKVSGKNVEAWKVSPQEIERLKKEVAENQKRASGANKFDREYSQPSEGYSENVIDISPTPSELNNINTNQGNLLINMMDKYREDIKEVSFTFLKELKEKDRQVLLLQDSERIKENGYLEQIAKQKTEIEQLKVKITMLEAENQQLKQKSFFGIKFGK